MPLAIGVDLGTTKITALALDCTTGKLVAHAAVRNRAERTSSDNKARGYSEWDIREIADLGCSCLIQVSQQLGPQRDEVVGIGNTGQQHGGVVVDPQLKPLTPFVGWQDRRGEEPFPGRPEFTYVRHMQELAGTEAARRTGCRLSTGYLGVTLYWMAQKGLLPAGGKACFVTDYFGALLTGAEPVTEPTSAASSGLLNLQTNRWDADLLEAFGLDENTLPRLVGSGELLGTLTAEMAAKTGFRKGLPVYAGIGDHQASYLGSVADRKRGVLVNVGTGGQVASFTADFHYDTLLETRPFPRGGYVLVSAGLSGGAAYAVLERFFREVGSRLFGLPPGPSHFAVMNELAASVPRGADGLRCEPYFAGTRARPELRGSFTGISTTNFTPRHFARALLEGMARTFQEGYGIVSRNLSEPRPLLVGAGNGVRENPVLAQIIAEEFATILKLPVHQEEAAFGAALLAAVSAGIFPTQDAAGKLIRYAE